MQNSNIFSLNWRDAAKGLIVAVFSGILGAIYLMLQNGGNIDWKQVGLVAVTSVVGYLIKNFFSGTPSQN